MDTQSKENTMDSSKTPLVDEESRQQLAEKMDKDIQDFIAEKAKNRPTDEDDDLEKTPAQLAEELKQHPAFMDKIDLSKPLSPAMEALQALKYNTDSAEVNADSYKDDGNDNFKRKKYRWSIDNYTQGLREKSANKELNAILHSNRAAAHYHIGNYRSSLTDCVMAQKFKPDHMKAIVRGAMCCMEMKRSTEAVEWCDIGLALDAKQEKMLEIRTKAFNLKKKLDRDERKAKAMERREDDNERKLLEAIKNCGVNIKLKGSSRQSKDDSLSSSLTVDMPNNARVYLDDKDVLHWPVLFLYPESGETDFIMAFNEQTTLSEHMEHMFGKDATPMHWDQEHKYTADRIQVWFEADDDSVHQVDTSQPLRKVLQDKRLVINGGGPTFFLLVKDDAFTKKFFQNYKHS